jgi:hypothetical protein
MLDRKAKFVVWITLSLGLAFAIGPGAIVPLPLFWLLATDHAGAWKFMRLLLRAAAILTAVLVVRTYREAEGTIGAILFGALAAGAIAGIGELMSAFLGPRAVPEPETDST